MKCFFTSLIKINNFLHKVKILLLDFLGNNFSQRFRKRKSETYIKFENEKPLGITVTMVRSNLT